MAKKSLLPRGFMANAEKIAIELRKELSLHPHDPLCGFKLAEHMEIIVCTPLDFFNKGINLEQLVGTQTKNGGWSALTMKREDRRILIIHNHLHASTRQQSNIMHELAHIICDHKHSLPPENIPLPDFMRQHNKQNEEEANYLGATLQITREGLIWALKKRMSISDIADYYSASESMVNLRINSTGVKKQLSYMS